MQLSQVTHAARCYVMPYGPCFAEEILAQFGHKFIGRMECAASAEWASALVGDQEANQLSFSYTSGQHPTSTTTTQKVVRRGVLPSEILDFPPCNFQNGLTGLFFVPGVGVFRDTIDGNALFIDGAPVPADIPAYQKAPVEKQFLKPWTTEQRLSLGLSVESEATSDAKDKTADSVRSTVVSIDQLDL